MALRRTITVEWEEDWAPLITDELIGEEVADALDGVTHLRPLNGFTIRVASAGVLGRCEHDVDLDRDICPHGCRV